MVDVVPLDRVLLRRERVVKLLAATAFGTPGWLDGPEPGVTSKEIP